MSCDRANELMLDYIAGEMHEEARPTFEAHLETCGSCRRELARLAPVLALVKEEPAIEAPETEISACAAVADKALKPIASPIARGLPAKAADYAFGVGSILAFALLAYVMSAFRYSLSLESLFSFVQTHQTASVVAAVFAALVTCFVPIVMHAQRRTIAHGKGETAWQRSM